MSIGENILRLRESRGMTQEEFGDIADVSSMAVSQWENGRAVPRMGAVQKIADYFGINKSEIIDEQRPIPSGAKKTAGMAMGYVPLRGRVHAGPFTHPENLEAREELVLVPQHLIDSDPGVYACEVEGDCMNKVYPESNCIIVVSPNKEPKNGSIAVVTLDGCDALVRRMYKTANTLVLSPESWNPEHKDIIITADSDHTVEFGGKVVWYQAAKEME